MKNLVRSNLFYDFIVFQLTQGMRDRMDTSNHRTNQLHRGLQPGEVVEPTRTRAVVGVRATRNELNQSNRTNVFVAG